MRTSICAEFGCMQMTDFNKILLTSICSETSTSSISNTLLGCFSCRDRESEKPQSAEEQGGDALGGVLMTNVQNSGRPSTCSETSGMSLKCGRATGLPTGEGAWEERAQAATLTSGSSLWWKTELKQLKGSGRSLPGCNTPSILRK